MYLSQKAATFGELSDEQLIAIYRGCYANKLSDKAVLVEVETILKDNEDYIKFLTTSNGKIRVSMADYAVLKSIKKNIHEHMAANYLLYETEGWNEFHINWAHEGSGVECKSLLDRLIINTDEKKIVIVDLKTTKNPYGFKDSMLTYKYYRQMAFYTYAALWYVQNELKMNAEEFSLEIYIIAIGKDPVDIRVFRVDEDVEMKEEFDIIDQALNNIAQHQKLGDWVHSLSYHKANGIERL
jgi:Holliday junction resolvase-like predicted endonuclease